MSDSRQTWPGIGCYSQSMTLDPEQCYSWIQARDPRVDGLFFTGVKTPGIYCRSVCPARTPLRKNVVFLKSAAEAQAKGFRACRRCRPELVSQNRSPSDQSGLVKRALDKIDEGFLDLQNFSALSEALGTSERHLRRLFQECLGAGPSQVLRTQRLARARALLEDSNLQITEVAFAAGFTSLRQLHDTFRRVHGISPGQWRRQNFSEATAVSLRLRYQAPLDWNFLCTFLGERAIPGLDFLEPGAYRRRDKDLEVEVRPGLEDYLEVTFRGDFQIAELFDIGRKIRRLFDLDLNPQPMEQTLGSDPRLRPHLQGLRVPGSWDPFETTVRTILGQRVSVAAATTLCARLMDRFGKPGHFPKPEELKCAPLEELGIPRTRAQTLRDVSERITNGTLSLQDPGELQSVLGIGPWTAGYLAMRVSGQTDAFPHGDLVLRKALGVASDKELEKSFLEWSPWRAYAAMALWRGGKNGLSCHGQPPGAADHSRRTGKAAPLDSGPKTGHCLA